jgi:hypothetical protein
MFSTSSPRPVLRSFDLIPGPPAEAGQALLLKEKGSNAQSINALTPLPWERGFGEVVFCKDNNTANNG